MNKIKKINKLVNTTKFVEVACIVTWKENGIEHHKYFVNSKGVSDLSLKHTSHAEYKANNFIKENGLKDVDVMISLIPCSKCRDEMVDNISDINKIEYILDFRGKKESRDNIEFNKAHGNKLVSIYDEIASSKNGKYIWTIWYPLRKRLSSKRHRASTRYLLRKLGIIKSNQQKWINATKQLNPNGEYEDK